MPITPGGRWSPNDSDEWDLTTDLAAMQVSNESATTAQINAALLNVPQNYRIGTNAQRLALTGANLFEGLEFYTTDTDLRWFYSGTTWLPADPGSYMIRPTSVAGSGVTLGADGMANFTGSTSVLLNGVFSSRFRRYRIEIVIDSTSADGDMRFNLANGGIAVGPTAHSWVASQIENGVGPSRSQGVNEATARLGRVATTGSYCTVDLANPANAARKMASFSGIDGSLYGRQGGFTVGITTSVDGFAMTTTNSAAATGRIRVYGLV